MIYLNQNEIADYHVPLLLRGVHVTEIRLGGQPGRQRHFEVALQAQQRGHQNHQLVYFFKHDPVLQNLTIILLPI